MPAGRLFLRGTADFDEFQHEVIVENTCAGLKAAKKRGRRGGRTWAMHEWTLKRAEAMLRDTANHRFVGNVTDQLEIGRTAFYRNFRQTSSSASEKCTPTAFVRSRIPCDSWDTPYMQMRAVQALRQGRAQLPIFARTSDLRNLSMKSMNPTDGISRISAVMDAIW